MRRSGAGATAGAPGRHRWGRLWLGATVVAAVQSIGVLVGGAIARASSVAIKAAPTPSPCPAITGCGHTQLPAALPPTPSGGTRDSLITDPLQSVANACAQAAIWLIDHLSSAIDSTTQIDFTNAGFLRQYAIVFAASTVLTVILWLLAVVKRALRGDSLVTALGEATGLLWIAVLASAFTPVVLYFLVSITDSITNAIAGDHAGTSKFLDGFANALQPNSKLGGGPVALIFVSLLSMLAAAMLWLELLIRAAMLYVGAALATVVYAGLVDRALWAHTKRWIGLMISIVLIKPIVVIVLSLASAVSDGGAPGNSLGAVISGLAILFLAVFAGAMVYRFVPTFGDEVLALRESRRNALSGGGVPAAVNSPAAQMRAGIATHAARGPNPAAAAGAAGGGGEGPRAIGSPSAAVAMGAGVVAHGARGAASRLTRARHQLPVPPTPPPAPPPQPQPPRQINRGDGG
jgi:hypothetical protein